jgi:hypothetical protein
VNVDPETGIWSLAIAKKRHKFDEPLAGAVFLMYDKPEFGVDIGCGLGYYSSYLFSFGWTMVGIEGTPEIDKISSHSMIVEADLTKPLNTTRYLDFDFSLCLEVGEHIPPKHEKQFIDNVCELSCKDLVLSWAVPGQYSASGHVNCQDNQSIIDKFEDRGFEFDDEGTNLLRSIASFNWFKNTLMCFEKRESRDA